jgi:hypothetical protein
MEGPVPPPLDAKYACGELSTCSTACTSAADGSTFFSPLLLQADNSNANGKMYFFIFDSIARFENFVSCKKKHRKPNQPLHKKKQKTGKSQALYPSNKR